MTENSVGDALILISGGLPIRSLCTEIDRPDCDVRLVRLQLQAINSESWRRSSRRGSPPSAVLTQLPELSSNAGMRRLLSVTSRFLSLTIKFALITIVLHYLIFGSPRKDLGNMFWPEDAAPWETVDAYYYPDAKAPSRFETATGLASRDECRKWAHAAAARNRDPDFVQGDYECGIGKVNEFESIPIYRIVAQ